MAKFDDREIRVGVLLLFIYISYQGDILSNLGYLHL